MFDYIVLGAGPAGASFATYISRASKSCLLIYKDEGLLDKVQSISNYYPFSDISGHELFSMGLNMARNSGAEIVAKEVIDIVYASDKLIVKTAESSYECKKLVLALGRPNAKNSKYKKYISKGVSLCAHCDGPMWRGMHITYTGDPLYIDSLKEELEIYSSDLEYIPYENISSFNGDEYLESITLKDGSIKEVMCMFVASKVSVDTLSSKLGLLTKNGLIVTDNTGKTSQKNVLAIGACTSIYNQVSVSVGDAARVALEEIKNNG